jgi:hypothetical protein
MSVPHFGRLTFTLVCGISHVGMKENLNNNESIGRPNSVWSFGRDNSVSQGRSEITDLEVW